MILEIARIEREALRNISARMAAQQLGEAWRDLPETDQCSSSSYRTAPALAGSQT